MNVELWICLKQILVFVLEALELDLVECITGVGDQLPQEDFLQNINTMRS